MKREESGSALATESLGEITHDVCGFGKPLQIARFTFDQEDRYGRSTEGLDQLATMIGVLLGVTKRELETQRTRSVDHPAAIGTPRIAV